MPMFRLRLFDETDDERKARETREREERRRDERGRYLPYDDIEKANAKIHELNQENASRRTENKALNDAIAKLTGAIEGLQKDTERSKERIRRAEIKAALVEAKVIDPDVTELFLKHAGDKIKFDESGELVGVKESLTEFKRAKPHFFPAEPVLDDKGQPVLENGKPKMTAGYQAPTTESSSNGTQPKPNSTSRGASTASTVGGESGKVVDLMAKDEKGEFIIKNPDAALDAIARQMRVQSEV